MIQGIMNWESTWKEAVWLASFEVLPQNLFVGAEEKPERPGFSFSPIGLLSQ
jgi:hypothetical protein